MKLVETRSLRKTFPTRDGELPVLEGIDVNVREGEIVALLGRSGSGKSTLLRCIAGLSAPTDGLVLYVRRHQPRRRHGLPELRAAPLADRPAERRARPGSPRHGSPPEFADRVIVLGTNPGTIKAEIPVTLDRPRDRRAPDSKRCWTASTGS